MRRVWPTGGLWRHRDFLKLWSAETISLFGSQVSQLAHAARRDPRPRRERVRGRRARQSSNSFRSSCSRCPAGVWVDRLRRRPILIAGDFGRAALLRHVPIAYVGDVLTLGSAVRRRLPRRGRARSSSTSRTSRTCPRSSSASRSSTGTRSSRSAAPRPRSAAPDLRGLLVQVFTAPYAVLVDA